MCSVHVCVELSYYNQAPVTGTVFRCMLAACIITRFSFERLFSIVRAEKLLIHVRNFSTINIKFIELVRITQKATSLSIIRRIDRNAQNATPVRTSQ